MTKNAVQFLKDDMGAVTVDWVVLTAAIVTLAIGVLASVGSSTTTLSGKIGDTVAEYDVITY